jgi:hypothetical protein
VITDFLDAHHRHLRDADSLFNASRLANADHLYGMAAECGLKRLMIAFGMKTDTTGDPTDKKNDRIHAEKVWMRYETYQSGHVQGSRYGLPSSINPFDDWKAEQRYGHSQCFNNSRVDPHRTAAHSIHFLVKSAEIEGLV